MILDNSLLNRLAILVIEGWFLAMGFEPSDGWDADDPHCLRVVDGHTLWTYSAHVPDDVDMDEAEEAFFSYMDHHNMLPTATKFFPYGLEFYECSCGCGTYVFATIYR